VPLFAQTRITSDGSQPNFQHAFAAMDLGPGPFASATLVVDLESPCYPFSKWQADPPPAGQSWPDACDAFDRNFEFSLDDPLPDAGPDAGPGLELERAITPFGGPLHLSVDMTDVANGLPGPHLLQVTIPTYGDAAGRVSGAHGSWLVTARIDVVPGPAPRRVLAVRSLFDGALTSYGAEPLVGVTTPPGATRARLELRATGHGGGPVAPGCIGPAEEFCERTHELKVDGVGLGAVALWRTDCDQLCTLTHQGPTDGGFDYCLQDPCGDPASVRAPRANWCPGSETPPLVAEPAALGVPGLHQVTWHLSRIAGGGLWRTSLTYFAYGD
jgi:hypothetical protein